MSSVGFNASITSIGTEPAALWAVLAVETSGCGYLPDRRPKILFERHIFHKLTGGRYDADYPDISAPTQGGYGPGGANQYLRLAAAMQLNSDAAMQSASWGLGQIMGMNFSTADYDSVEDMVDAFVTSEDSQLGGMANFVSGAAAAALVAKDWTSFARLYNGPNYAASDYDGHLAQFYNQYTNQLPDITVRAAQVYLSYLGYNTGGIDGMLGPATRASLTSFQGSKGLPVTGLADDATMAALAAPPADPDANA
jgi:hypothetical protein